LNNDEVAVVVIGGGVAGLSAAVSAAQDLGGHGRVALLERAPEREAGGSTRWTDAYFRLKDVYEPADGFVEDMMEFSKGKTDRAYVEALVEHLPEAMEWIQGQGVRFQRRATYFVTASRPRMMPVGGGEAIVRELTRAAVDFGVQIRYRTRAVDLQQNGQGFTVSCESNGATTELACRACIIASGGFEGDADLLARHLGEPARGMKPIAPGAAFNTGDIIERALALGVASSGDWAGFHGEPVDRRSTQPEASVMVFPYGILVNNRAERFIDEGVGTVDETYEDLARAILRQPDAQAFFITDSAFDDIPGITRGLLTDRGPERCETLQKLAAALDLPAAPLEDTVAEFNAAITAGSYDPLRRDGKCTSGIQPPKSNWAMALTRPPFLGIPLTTDIVFTYGGLATNSRAQAVDTDGAPIDRLYAAGECTGIYYHKYPGATSVMRGLVFGRMAGRRAAKRSLA
jgi:tricarballylate dehydrogenase